jgi:integrase
VPRLATWSCHFLGDFHLEALDDDVIPRRPRSETRRPPRPRLQRLRSRRQAHLQGQEPPTRENASLRSTATSPRFPALFVTWAVEPAPDSESVGRIPLPMASSALPEPDGRVRFLDGTTKRARLLRCVQSLHGTRDSMHFGPDGHASCGARRGELLAQRWDAVDLGNAAWRSTAPLEKRRSPQPSSCCRR